MMGMKNSMASMPPAPQGPPVSGMDDDKDDDGDQDDLSNKMLAIQNLLGGIRDIASDDMKPYIEEMQQKMHMNHEQKEGDSVGMDNSEDQLMGGPDTGLEPKGGMGIVTGAGGPPDEDDEDDDDKKAGFLAILSRKMKK